MIKNKKWSGYVTKHSFALDLEEDVFTWDNPRKIAESLKKSAEASSRRKGTAFQSAMSMLNFYINRAGKNLDPKQRKILEQAKEELRKVFSRPKRLTMSFGLKREEFEKIVAEGIKVIPEKFLRKLDNVAIVFEDEPTPVQKKKLNIHPGWALFGLYEGIPQAKRGINYSGVLPDKITIFQKPIEEEADSEEEIKEIVKNTVWHEIAHHFGMSEVRVRQAEARRRKLLRQKNK